MLITAWLVCVIGWGVVLKMPDQYSASARVHVDTQSMLRPLLRGLATQANVGREVKLITRTMLSRPNMEKLARIQDKIATLKRHQAINSETSSPTIPSEVQGIRIGDFAYRE